MKIKAICTLNAFYNRRNKFELKQLCRKIIWIEKRCGYDYIKCSFHASKKHLSYSLCLQRQMRSKRSTLVTSGHGRSWTAAKAQQKLSTAKIFFLTSFGQETQGRSFQLHVKKNLWKRTVNDSTVVGISTIHVTTE